MSEEEADLDGIGEEEQTKNKRKSAKQIAKQREAQLDDSIRWFMSDARGRLVMTHFLESTGVHQPNPYEAPITAGRAEGKREVGIYWRRRVMDLCFEDYVKLQREERTLDE